MSCYRWTGCAGSIPRPPAAIPTGGLSLAAGAAGGVAGGGVIGKFFHKGLKVTDEDAARIGRELAAGHAAVGVLTWDSDTKAVADKLSWAELPTLTR